MAPDLGSLSPQSWTRAESGLAEKASLYFLYLFPDLSNPFPNCWSIRGLANFLLKLSIQLAKHNYRIGNFINQSFDLEGSQNFRKSGNFLGKTGVFNCEIGSVSTLGCIRELL